MFCLCSRAYLRFQWSAMVLSMGILGCFRCFVGDMKKTFKLDIISIILIVVIFYVYFKLSFFYLKMMVCHRPLSWFYSVFC